MAILLTVQYLGTRYHGFQRQADTLPTIQGELEATLSGLLGPGTLLGGGRTDTGVHAAGQRAVWQGPCPVPLERLAEVVNRRLPDDIRVADPQPVDDGFDPQRDAKAKAYCYRIWRPTTPPPLPLGLTVHPCSRPLSWRTLQAAARLMEGTHDFWAFRSEGSSARGTVRTVLASRWEMEHQGAVWAYRVVATGFLYHMVRIMVGGMLRCAEEDSTGPILGALNHPRGKKLGPVAPPCGLTLEWIAYA